MHSETQHFLCGLIGAVLYSGNYSNDINPPNKVQQNGKKISDGTATVETLKQILEAFVGREQIWEYQNGHSMEQQLQGLD